MYLQYTKSFDIWCCTFWPLYLLKNFDIDYEYWIFLMFGKTIHRTRISYKTKRKIEFSTKCSLVPGWVVRVGSNKELKVPKIIIFVFND